MLPFIRIVDIGLQAQILYDEAINNENKSDLSKTSKVLSAIGLAFQAFTSFGEMEGISSEKLTKVKDFEIVVRFFDYVIKNFEAAEEERNNNADDIQDLIRSCVVPIFSFIRAIQEWNVYERKAYFELPLEARTGLTRTVLDQNVHEREELIDPIKMQSELEFFEANLPAIHLVETALKYKGKRDHETKVFIDALKQKQGPILNRRIYDRAQQIIAALQTGKPAKDSKESVDPFNLLQAKEIPDYLFEDIFFAKYKCSITLAPIRDPVGDPTTRGNGQKKKMVLYERSAIVDWLKKSNLSPSSKQPLTIQDLVEQPFVKALIEERLRFYSLEFRKLSTTPVDPQILHQAVQENPQYA